MMTPLNWIIVSGVAMSIISLVGAFTLLLKASTLEKLLLPLVAFAAGSLLGGAFINMLPAARKANVSVETIGILVLVGFTTFFILEQFLHWRHNHQLPNKRKEAMTYLILIGDGLHNFIGGMAIGGIFLIDIRLGIASWLAAALHEVPQELGDFAVLMEGGWSKSSALTFNLLSGLTFLLGGLAAYILSFQTDVSWLIPFAAGNFIYIGASDLVSKVNQQTTQNFKDRAISLVAFISGVSLLFLAIPR
jgi:zinc and cadmium transporter